MAEIAENGDRIVHFTRRPERCVRERDEGGAEAAFDSVSEETSGNIVRAPEETGVTFKRCRSPPVQESIQISIVGGARTQAGEIAAEEVVARWGKTRTEARETERGVEKNEDAARADRRLQRPGGAYESRREAFPRRNVRTEKRRERRL